jgi:hypothetical protein
MELCIRRVGGQVFSLSGDTMMDGRDMERQYRQQLEIGDEVIGDENVRGRIIRTKDIYDPCKGDRNAVREYLVKSENGARLVYAGEHNLQLVKTGLGDAAPPRPDLLEQLNDDLKRRPLAGVCF